jgi:hypothetical protein
MMTNDSVKGKKVVIPPKTKDQSPKSIAVPAKAKQSAASTPKNTPEKNISKNEKIEDKQESIYSPILQGNQRIQTVVGWKRSMLKKRAEQTKKTTKG